MTPEALFHQMLGLGTEWQVTACEFDRPEGLVRIEVRETPALWQKRCGRCGGALSCYDHTEVLEWRHLNVFEHRCDLRCRLPRSRCADCKRIVRMEPPWEGLSKHFTKGFEAFALMLARQMPVAQMARILGENDTRLWRMLQAHVEAARARLDFCNVICVGVDEMSVRKGHRYISVFADLKEKRVLFGTPGKDASVWERFADELGRHNGHPHALTHVSMDMSAPYQKGVAQHCRNAKVVFDKYHLIAHANAAVDQARKAESSSGGAASELLRKTLWLWRKNPEHLTEKEQARLEQLNTDHLWTAKAYQLRLSLQQIYQEKEAASAREKFKEWGQLVRAIGQSAPKVVWAALLGTAKMIETHIEGILAHWEHRLTNA